MNLYAFMMQCIDRNNELRIRYGHVSADSEAEAKGFLYEKYSKDRPSGIEVFKIPQDIIDSHATKD